MDTRTVTPLESRTEAMRRLLAVARESGVKLGRDQYGEYWASSVSEPGRLYRVEPDSCGCRGFQMHRRCRHVAALWQHLGYLDDPEPEPEPIPDSCPHCKGTGEVPSTERFHGRYVSTWLRCTHCLPTAA